ncbi:lysine-2,3-aminomutase-like protein [Mangrovicoccus algicola]|uniref:Lysine-2,3-aminomutase-like protein n=1 Tax=Mangrovicoccus algicola TaxID=2771008 RepID=A0A8J7CX42_9RHOB|nr:lysine-2,3-aminomutase-like protein [Mangrovicoccus algicola]MBE3640139.1 lysine-2,3-aminomutase-like protein [Mangrovicoccus algicola]
MSSAQRGARSLGDLQEAGLVGPEVSAELRQVADRYAVSVTPGILRALRDGTAGEGIARQYIPAAEELRDSPAELDDPIGDGAHAPVAGVVHRYDDRVLLNVLKTCAVYCRFCFRREMVGPGARGLDADGLAAALDYIRSDPRIWEVILSGGDPLTLSPRRIRAILSELAEIGHVGVVRFHTRIPSVAPEMVTEDLLEALRAFPAVYVVLHANHPEELTPEVRGAIARIVDRGIPMLSQTVLLRGVNDDAAVLGDLFKGLVRNRVKPYYLHHADMARGTGHFRTTIAEGQAVVEALRAGHSGLCQPHYVLDLPGGAGKVPIPAARIVPREGGGYAVRDSRGDWHGYDEDVPERGGS